MRGRSRKGSAARCRAPWPSAPPGRPGIACDHQSSRGRPARRPYSVQGSWTAAWAPGVPGCLARPAPCCIRRNIARPETGGRKPLPGAPEGIGQGFESPPNLNFGGRRRGPLPVACSVRRDEGRRREAAKEEIGACGKSPGQLVISSRRRAVDVLQEGPAWYLAAAVVPGHIGVIRAVLIPHRRRPPPSGSCQGGKGPAYPSRRSVSVGTLSRTVQPQRTRPPSKLRPTATARHPPPRSEEEIQAPSSQRTTARTRTPKSLRHLRPYPARSSYAASAIALVSATVIRSRGGAPRRPASGAAASVILRRIRGIGARR